MSVKGVKQHRLIGAAMSLMLAVDSPTLTSEERADCERLRRRADLAIDRMKRGRTARVPQPPETTSPEYIAWQCQSCLNECCNEGRACPCGEPGPLAVAGYGHGV